MKLLGLHKEISITLDNPSSTHDTIYEQYMVKENDTYKMTVKHILISGTRKFFFRSIMSLCFITNARNIPHGYPRYKTILT